MNKKPFYKCWWFWLTISMAFLLCVGNIVLAHFKKDSGANIFTAVSGWVSGIATAILGAIAVVQNRKYKEENDSYLLAQDQREWRLEQKESIKVYLNNIIGIYQEIQNYQYSKVLDECIKDLNEKSPFTIITMVYMNTLKCLYDKLTFSLINCIYFFDKTDELLDKSFRYFSNLNKQIDGLQRNIENGEGEFINELYAQYLDVTDIFNIYILELQIFISYTMTNSSPKEVEEHLNEMRAKQIAWREKMKKQLNEEQNNG